MAYKVFKMQDFNTINESAGLSDSERAVKAFLKIPGIRMSDGKVMKPSVFVDKVNAALRLFQERCPYEYKYIKYCTIYYLTNSTITSTMAVDNHNNLYINVEFLYSFLKMNKEYIFYILYHECTHRILNHVDRGIKYGKTHNKLTFKQLNICSDYEVNGIMVADHICTPDDWLALKGCYDEKYKGLTFEMIADKVSKSADKDHELHQNPKNQNDEEEEDIDDMEDDGNVPQPGENEPGDNANKNDKPDAENGEDDTDNATEQPGMGEGDEGDGEEEEKVGQGTGGGGGAEKPDAKDDLPSTDVSNDSMVGEILPDSVIEEELKDSMLESGYDEEDANELAKDALLENQPDAEEIRDDIIENKENTTLAQICMNIKADDAAVEEVWESLLSKFLSKNATYGGSNELEDNPEDTQWGNRNFLYQDDIVMPYQGKTSSAPQYINILMDCSGSIYLTLALYFMDIIKKLFYKLEYSGIRIIPFGDRVDKNHILTIPGKELVENKKEAEAKMDDFVKQCSVNHYGGQGNSFSFKAIAGFTYENDADEPDSVYAVFTDGELFDTNNINKLKHCSERTVFCITIPDMKELKKNHYLRWCLQPQYDFVEKIYIELDK